ncbi:hypothetical protein N7512_002999 [Penicillium capsulatum]|nr:hypothetical protein N7512_002999 [Penicillium capsulatum]
MATLNTLQKCKVPVWAWRFKQSTGRLLYVLRVLQHTQKPDVADFVLRCLHIELHELSFESGATCSSGNVYFMPRTDGSCSIARSRRIAMYGDDEFITFRDMRNAGIHKELPLHSHLFAAFNTYACNFHMMDSFLSWKPIT